LITPLLDNSPLSPPRSGSNLEIDPLLVVGEWRGVRGESTPQTSENDPMP
jgi:hypothetical protein